MTPGLPKGARGCFVAFYDALTIVEGEGLSRDRERAIC